MVESHEGRGAETHLPWFDPAVPAGRALAIVQRAYGTESVPAGWQPLWRDTLRQLVAVRTKEREISMASLRVRTCEGDLEFDMPRMDFVLAGICRRCTERSRFLCRQCGRSARKRKFGVYEWAPLCPRCAAPALLHRAIDDVTRYSGLIAIGGKVEEIRRVPVVLHKAFMRACEAEPAATVAKGTLMTAAALRQWIAALAEVKQRLPAETSYELPGPPY